MRIETEHVRRARTLVVDDHPVYRLGLRIVLSREADIEVVGEAACGEEAMALAAQLVLDVAIVDLHMPEGDGIALTRSLRAQNPECHVLALSGDSEPLMIAQVLQAGASGYFSKTQDVGEIVEAIRTIRSGQRYLPPSVSLGDIDAGPVQGIARLSAREREVLVRLVDGQSNDEIASALFVSRRTVETHRQRIMNKLGAHTIAALVHIAARLGVVSR